MKKAFTLIEIFICIVIIAIIALLVGAFTQSKKSPTPTPVPKNFTVLSREATGAACCEPYIIIVKDSQTEQEYIIIEDGSGVSITPRLKKKEE